jgi:transposase
MANRFSNDFKQSSIDYALAHSDQPLKALAEHLGIGYSTLDRWVRLSAISGSSARPLSAEQLRIKALEKEVKELRAINDILKKAHVYFVNHPSR